MRLIKFTGLIMVSALLCGLVARNEENVAPVVRPQEKTSESCGIHDPAWQSCSQDSDCVLGHNACGFPAAYNKQSLEAVEKYNKCMGPVIACPEIMMIDPPDPPICKDGVCAFYETPADNGQ